MAQQSLSETLCTSYQYLTMNIRVKRHLVRAQRIKYKYNLIFDYLSKYVCHTATYLYEFATSLCHVTVNALISDIQGNKK